MNLTARSLAAVLKYDRKIPQSAAQRKETGYGSSVCKGYYSSEQPIVDHVKRCVVGDIEVDNFRTVECCVMDISDDIAYSTYDLEDSFKAGFLSPLFMMACDDDFKAGIAKKIKSKLDQYYSDIPSSEREFGISDVNEQLLRTFGGVFSVADKLFDQPDVEWDVDDLLISGAGYISRFSDEIGKNGYLRTDITSSMVGDFIRGIEVVPHPQHPKIPQLFQARLNIDTFKQVEVLKMYSYDSLIMSPRLKVSEHRGKSIINSIFNTLVSDGGHALMPDDWRSLYQSKDDNSWHKRVVCDFIAGMTDRYCVDFYNRINGVQPSSIHTPF